MPSDFIAVSKLSECTCQLTPSDPMAIIVCEEVI